MQAPRSGENFNSHCAHLLTPSTGPQNTAGAGAADMCLLAKPSILCADGARIWMVDEHDGYAVLMDPAILLGMSELLIHEWSNILQQSTAMVWIPRREHW